MFHPVDPTVSLKPGRRNSNPPKIHWNLQLPRSLVQVRNPQSDIVVANRISKFNFFYCYLKFGSKFKSLQICYISLLPFSHIWLFWDQTHSFTYFLVSGTSVRDKVHWTIYVAPNPPFIMCLDMLANNYIDMLHGHYGIHISLCTFNFHIQLRVAYKFYIFFRGTWCTCLLYIV